MENIRDITALEQLPAGLANANRNRNRNSNTQGRNSTNCQGQTVPTCNTTCGITTIDGSTNA
ncbi:MAG: hypothetical protein ACRDTH_10920 [Pseudonocardiaceae bacterium]